MSATRLLAVLALTAVLAAGCGNGSSSSDGASSGGDATTAASGALELRPVYAHYTQGGPLGRVPLGPSVPQDLLSAMKGHDCSSQPAELQGMLLVCDSDHTVYLLKDPIVSGGVASATPKDTGHHQLWFLEVALDPDATSTLAQATQSMPGTELAFVVDDKVLSAPIIDASMADGHLGITGDFDQAQATSLAQQITTS